MAARRSAWKTVAVLLGALGVLVAAFLGWMEWTTARGWAELRHRSKIELAEELPRPLPRTLLRPAVGQGRAWTEYAEASTAAERLPSAGQSLLLNYLRTDNSNLRGEVRILLEGYGDILELLARGASAADPDSGAAAWNAGPENRTSWRLHHVATLGLCAARLDVERGREAEAVDRIGQVLQLARDLLDLWPSQGVYKSQSMLSQVRALLGNLLAERKLGASGRAELERLLGALEASWPSTDAVLRRVCIETRRGMVEAEAAGKLDGYMRGGRGLLQRLLTERQRVLAYEQSCRAELQGARGSDQLDGKAFRDLFNEWGHSPEGGGYVLMYGHCLRQARAEAALMSAALAWVRTGQPPKREDPSGTFLMSKPEAGGLLLWAAGWNGLDDGGGKHDAALRARR